MSENGEIYTDGKNFTLPPAVTALTNSTSVRRVRKFLSESDNLKEINRQQKNSDTSDLIDATLKKLWHKFLKYQIGTY